MIRNNINELFIKLDKYYKWEIKQSDFENIIKEAFNYLNELRNNYYLIPKQNIDNKITFEFSSNIDAKLASYYANFRVTAVTSIKKSLLNILELDPIKNFLRMNLIRELEKENK